jgi:hypothetical protein
LIGIYLPAMTNIFPGVKEHQVSSQAIQLFLKMQNASIDPALVHKYNRPVPRYTSYPTVPFWTDQFDAASWEKAFVRRFHEQNHTNGISLYIHCLSANPYAPTAAAIKR